MVQLNLVLWMAMMSFTLAPVSLLGRNDMSRWIAVAGFVVAALWEHSVIRGRKNSNSETTQGGDSHGNC